MEVLLPPDAQMSTFDTEKIVRLLHHASGTVRARALPTIGARLTTTPALKEYLFTSVEDPANLQLVFYEFIKVAWIAALVILDYGDTTDLSRLKDLVAKWPLSEQKGFLLYSKDHQKFDKLLSATIPNKPASITITESDVVHYEVRLSEQADPVHVRVSTLTPRQRNGRLRHRRTRQSFKNSTAG
ncbi:hypothetical protein HHL22_07795 [Hymenobacter sp. RP-2-7]|uniref:Uncharacterized protein n=1 Tax=Hymenobacter polaris TaxID=2682546 RepID=A0A7Y0AD26_9BACT|nr:hypothetical protein [Hymenobacter polaris]NML65107.1 hypothetical protein [Hymenobacter polaris]